MYPTLSQTTCLPEPPAPAAAATDQDVVHWIEGMRVAGEDCRTRLKKIDELKAAWPRKEN